MRITEWENVQITEFRPVNGFDLNRPWNTIKIPDIPSPPSGRERERRRERKRRGKPSWKKNFTNVFYFCYDMFRECYIKPITINNPLYLMEILITPPKLKIVIGYSIGTKAKTTFSNKLNDTLFYIGGQYVL